jgi:transposase
MAEQSPEASVANATTREIAWKVQNRLHRKFVKMTYQRKLPGKVMTALARELVGFIWAIGSKVEREALVEAT